MIGMKNHFRQKEGVLTFEWILLGSVLAIGMIAAVASMRTAYDAELSEVGSGMRALDSTYKLPSVVVDSSIPETTGGRYVGGVWVPSNKVYTRSAIAAGSHHNDTSSASHDQLIQMEAVEPANP